MLDGKPDKDEEENEGGPMNYTTKLKYVELAVTAV